jgi:hypothetical protein
MKTLFTFIGFILPFVSSVSAHALVLDFTRQEKVLGFDPFDLKLTYEDYEGSFNHPCKAEIAYPDNPYDFKVKCYNGEKLIRSFSLHLAITRYERAQTPRTQYEILFWVNGEGATSWLRFNELTKMQHFTSSQSIAREAATLRMKLDLP